MESLENKNTKEKTKRDVKLLEDFLENEKNDEREVLTIKPAESNKYLAEFFRSFRCKDGEDYTMESVCVRYLRTRWFVSEILLVRYPHSFDFRYLTNSCVNIFIPLLYFPVSFFLCILCR